MLSSANSEQQEAITNYQINTSVIACPGSGKTRVLELKTAYILENEPYDNIVAVTFTRDASIELANRIKGRVGNQFRRVKVSTFHSLCMEQLKSLNPKIKIIDEYHQRQLIYRTIQEKNIDISFEQGVKTINFLKSRLHTKKLPKNNSTYLLQCYNYQLKKYKLVDFSDLLIKTTEGIRDGHIKPLNTKHLMVDEFQDTDPLQYAWISEHAIRGVNITCVGDDDQSIYSFRHAMGNKGLRQYEKEFEAKQIKLGINYRSHYEIIDHAEQLILKNSESRIDKEFIAYKGSGGLVKAIKFTSKDEESFSAIEYMTNEPEKWAVLGRNNDTLNNIEAELTTFNIPYTRVGGKRFWDKPPVTELIGLLNALTYKNTMGLDHALIYCGLTETELNNLHNLSEDCTFDYLCNYKNIANKVTSIEARKKVISKLNSYLPGWLNQLNNKKRTSSVIRAVCQWLVLFSPNNNKANMLDAASEALCRMKGTLNERLNLIKIGKNKKKDKESGVQLITFHSSKGLEFKNVWLTGCQQNTIPHKDSDVDEERRLMYVAMTRAENNLYLSYVDNDEEEPSQFIKEAGLIKELDHT